MAFYSPKKDEIGGGQDRLCSGFLVPNDCVYPIFFLINFIKIKQPLAASWFAGNGIYGVGDLSLRTKRSKERRCRVQRHPHGYMAGMLSCF